MPATTTQTMPLSAEEREAERTLLESFVRYWSAHANDDLRTTYDGFIAATPPAADVTAVAVHDGEISGWWLLPPGQVHAGDAAILYLHGGAYVLGSATAYRHFASQIAARTNRPVFVLDYPLAPEHALPAAHDTAVAAAQWLARSGVHRLAVIGDSAGGGLSLSVLATLTRASAAGEQSVPTLAAGAMFSPWTDLSLCSPSMTDPAIRDVLLTRAYLADSAEKYLGFAAPTDPMASPLFGIPAGMPPLYIQVGSEELLRDDATRYAQQAREQGNTVSVEIWEGLHHVFQFNVVELASARSALDRVAGFLTGRL